ncbi:MAG: pyridoxamine 5'-phosphate oxidase [Planctomycetota bacterium]
MGVGASLDRQDLTAEPIELFRRWYDLAATTNSLAYPNSVVVATCGADGQPSARTVLLRHLDHGFVFFTNYQSRKGRDLAANPKAAMCFHWFMLERQVLVRGIVEQVSAAESDAYFAERPYGSRISAMTSQQSQPVADRHVLESRAAALRERHPDQIGTPRPPHWGGYRLLPHEIEFWQGRSDRLHDRFLYTKQADGSWTIERLQP